MRRSPLLPIFLIVMVDILGLTIMMPLLPFYAEHFGATPFGATMLVSIYAACSLVAGPLLGRISDSAGRKPVLLVSQAGTFIGFLILAYANALWLVFLSRIIDGLTAGNLSLAQAYIADVTAPRNRAKSFAVIGIAFGIGFLFGPALSGVLAQASVGQVARLIGIHSSLQYPILVAAGLSLTSILCTATLLPSTPPRPAEEPNLPSAEVPQEAPPAGRRLRLLDWGTYAQYFRRPVLAGLLWEFFLFTLAFATFTSGFALFAERRFTWHGVPFGPKQVGYVFAYSGFLGIILQGGLIGRLVKRFGEVRLITVGFLAAAIGYCLLGLSNTIALLLIAATFASFGSGVLRPALTSLITQNVSRAEQGVVLGLSQSLQSIALIVGPAIAGALIARGFLTTWGLWAGAITCVALVLNRKARGARQDAHGVEPARS